MAHMRMYDYRWLKEQAKKVGISLSESQLELFKRFEELLLLGTKRFNLTSAEPERIIPDHFLDSLSVVLCRCLKIDCRLVDVGSGAGFPGIPLKIAFPEIKLSLVESRLKRVQFLKRTVSELGLSSVKIIPERAEAAGHNSNLREKNNLAVARAVADLRVLLEYALPLLVVDGWFVALKGPKGTAEVELAYNASRRLGGEIAEIIPVHVVPGKIRNLILVKKISPTPAGFPRRVGIPSKRPLK